MANELQIMYQGASANLYVIVRNPADYKVWDVANTAWATWSNGSIGDYDIVMSDRGGDLYTADFPSSISVGTRVVATFYDRAGGSPAITDKVLDVADLTWDGAGVSSGSSVSLDSRALTTLASAKRHIGIGVTTHDTILTELINIWSDRIEGIAGRRFAAANYCEWHREDPANSYAVQNYPIIYINRVALGMSEALRVTYTGTGIRANVQVFHDGEGQNGGVRLRSLSTGGSWTETNKTFADSATVAALVTAIDAVSGWDATQTVNVPTAELAPIGGQDALNTNVSLLYADDNSQEYQVDHATGLIDIRAGYRQSAASHDRNVMIEYRGGYAAIPDDVSGICNELVAQAFATRSLNTALGSESLGGYSYSLADQVTISDGIDARLRSLSDVAVGGAY